MIGGGDGAIFIAIDLGTAQIFNVRIINGQLPIELAAEIAPG